MNRNALPPSLVANLQQFLVSMKTGKEEAEEEDKVAVEGEAEIEGDDAEEDSRPTILVTNGDGIESPGLIRLVEELHQRPPPDSPLATPSSSPTLPPVFLSSIHPGFLSGKSYPLRAHEILSGLREIETPKLG
ncbi:hypothetical protein Droror1_Dr00007192 [Drosera rotundifolia]